MATIQERLDRAARRLGVSQEQLTAIGAVSLGWTSAEFDLQYLIWTVLGLEQRIGEIVTNKLGNMTRPELLRNLVRARNYDAEFIAEIDDICAFFDAIRVSRNSLSHALAPEGDRSGNLTKRDVPKKPTGSVSSKVIDADVGNCLDTLEDMQTFRRCVVPTALNVKTALSREKPPATLSGHVATSPHIERMRSRLALLRKRQSSQSPS